MEKVGKITIFFKNYYMHNIEDQVELANVYHSTMVNLYNNTHGFGLHQRVLECMSVGGFIMMHPSKSDQLPGGVLTSFEEKKTFCILFF